MAEAKMTDQERAERLLRSEAKIAADKLLIDEDKEALRVSSEKKQEGFTIEVPGLGSVEVKKGRKARLKGKGPELDAEVYYTLSEQRQQTLLKDKIIEMVDIWTEAARPSVTVRL